MPESKNMKQMLVQLWYFHLRATYF